MCDTIFIFPAFYVPVREKKSYFSLGIKETHARSALVKNIQFRARISRKECGHFSEVDGGK